MANKTIYVKDDELWNRAKKLAGKEGLSGVIQNALTQYVAVKKSEAEGYKRYRLDVGFKTEGPPDTPEQRFGTTERIAFEGREVVTEALWVPAQNDPNNDSWQAWFTVYRTRGGKLILTVDDTGGNGFSHYGIYATLKELAADPYLGSVVHQIDRAEFLDAVSRELGEDWAVWIE